MGYLDRMMLEGPASPNQSTFHQAVALICFTRRRLMILIVWLMPLWVMFHWSITVLADGKVFVEQHYDPVVLMPDQRALIHFEQGVERLVIETRYKGAGTNFAWVIPLPAIPKIEAVKAELFTSLQTSLQPRLIHEVNGYWLAFIIAGFWIYLIKRSIQDEVSWLRDIPGCVAVAVLTGFYGHSAGLGLFVMGFMLLVRLVHAPNNVTIISIIFVIIWTVVGWLRYSHSDRLFTMMNSLADQWEPEVMIHERQRVGIYETATVSSSEPEALRRWLLGNGYAVPREAVPIFASYVRDGWCFVAAKIARNLNQAEADTIHPLGFTFPTTNAVYPLRLTGIRNPSCHIDLFLFGHQRATARHFTTVSCHETDHAMPTGEKRSNRRIELVPSFDEAVQSWIGNAPVVTQLSGHLSARDMSEDAVIHWQEFRYRRAVVFSRLAASTIGANLLSGIVVLGWLFTWMVEGGWGVTRAKQRRWYLVHLPIACP
jgi:hypothetical protein